MLSKQKQSPLLCGNEKKTQTVCLIVKELCLVNIVLEQAKKSSRQAPRRDQDTILFLSIIQVCNKRKKWDKLPAETKLTFWVPVKKKQETKQKKHKKTVLWNCNKCCFFSFFSSDRAWNCKLNRTKEELFELKKQFTFYKTVCHPTITTTMILSTTMIRMTTMITMITMIRSMMINNSTFARL